MMAVTTMKWLSSYATALPGLPVFLWNDTSVLLVPSWYKPFLICTKLAQVTWVPSLFQSGTNLLELSSNISNKNLGRCAALATCWNFQEIKGTERHDHTCKKSSIFLSANWASKKTIGSNFSIGCVQPQGLKTIAFSNDTLSSCYIFTPNNFQLNLY
jgi:hypothetical protein